MAIPHYSQVWGNQLVKILLKKRTSTLPIIHFGQRTPNLIGGDYIYYLTPTPFVERDIRFREICDPVHCVFMTENIVEFTRGTHLAQYVTCGGRGFMSTQFLFGMLF